MFEIGDKVRWTTGPGRPKVTVTDGPHWAKNFSGSPGWVVTFADGRSPRLIGGNVLEAIEEWAACPGEHRQTKDCTWERRN